MGILRVDLDNVNPDGDNKFYEDGSETIMPDFWLGIRSLKSTKLIKKI